MLADDVITVTMELSLTNVPADALAHCHQGGEVSAWSKPPLDAINIATYSDRGLLVRLVWLPKHHVPAFTEHWEEAEMEIAEVSGSTVVVRARFPMTRKDAKTHGII